MNEITIANVTTKNIEKGLVTASKNIRENGIKLAVYTAEYFNRKEDENKTDDIVNEIKHLTGLGNASISTLRKSGNLMIQFPFLQVAEYSKVYELRKIDETDIEDFCSKYNIAEMSQKAVRKAVDGYYIDTEEITQDEDTEEVTEDTEEVTEDTEEVIEEPTRNITSELLDLVKALDDKVDTSVKKSEIESFHIALTEIYNLIEKGV